MNRSPVIVASAAMVACVLVGEMAYRHMGSRPVIVDARSKTGTEMHAAPPAPRVEPAPARPGERPPVVVVERRPAPIVAEGRPSAPRVAATTPALHMTAARRPPDVVPGAPEPVVPVDVARAALAYVGADPEAEAVWYAAINDPSLSAHARQDLIEDLNEDGFADPRNVTADELPLVVSRLELIEAVAPDAMDQVNADAFAEAYKDLANMYVRLTGDE